MQVFNVQCVSHQIKCRTKQMYNKYILTQMKHTTNISSFPIYFYTVINFPEIDAHLDDVNFKKYPVRKEMFNKYIYKHLGIFFVQIQVVFSLIYIIFKIFS